MDLKAAAQLAEQLIAAHGLHEWKFHFDRARRRAGATHFTKKKITLSRELTQIYPQQIVRDVILHEIAHALVGEKHGHDRVWRAKCEEIGAKPYARLKESPEIQQLRPAAPWQGVCPNGHKLQRYRRPQHRYSCTLCATGFSPQFLISWKNTHTGEIL